MAMAIPHVLAGLSLAAYIRVSSDKQDAERQRQSIVAWAKSNGLTISHWFEDTSGRNPRDKAEQRQAFQNLLKAVERGSVQAIIVDSQDRFGTKNAYEFGKYVSQLAEYGCQLWSVLQGHLSADDPATILTSTVAAITSASEQVEKATRSIGGKLIGAKEGKYQGGYPPYGCDVVCFDARGSEKWRVVFVGHFQRQKISRNKKSIEAFDGKDNFPAKDPTDNLGVRPSVKKDRVKVVRQIFNWYDEEAISPAQIATRLNKMRVDPVFGESWNKQKIKILLTNPTYTGLPTFNKRGGSRFVEYRDGRLQRVSATKGKVVAGRKRSSADFVQPPKPLFDPIIPSDLFKRVQEKLDASSREHTNPNRKASRAAALWLRNYLICGKCNKPMRCQASTKGRNIVSYFCGTYGTFGKDNPTGCHCHRVKADILHKLVDSYLTEAGERLGLVLRNGMSRLDPAQTDNREFIDLHLRIVDIFAAMQSQLDGQSAEHGGKELPRPSAKTSRQVTIRPLTSQINGLGSFARAYEQVWEHRQPILSQRLETLRAEHSQLFARYSELPNSAALAIRKARERLLMVESEIHDIESTLRNLAEDVEEVIAQIVKRRRVIEQLRKQVACDAESRRKAELLGQVVERIVCNFRYTGSPNRAKSKLESVEIIPRNGDAVRCFPDGNTPGPG
jgi:DNA invertase Pin-like site-specific DNA recombinase